MPEDGRSERQESAAGAFPHTRMSAVLAARDDDPQRRRAAWERIIVAYWKPVFKYLRVKWNMSHDAAADTTQAFFTRAMEKAFFDSYDPNLAKFRTFLRTCLDRFRSNERAAAGRIKRGGAVPTVTMDFDGAEQEIAMSDAGLDQHDFFEREWMRSLMSVALERCRERCAAGNLDRQFAIFVRYDLGDPADRPTYAELASEFAVKVTDVTNFLARVRRIYRESLLDELRDLTASPEEFREEARSLLGINA